MRGIVTAWNKAAERMFSYTAAEMIGKPASILFPSDRTQEEGCILSQIRQGEVSLHDSARVAKDGHVVSVAVTASPILDGKGNIIGASTIARDLTQVKMAERALRNAEKLAVAGRMAATVAHEINGPLEAVARSRCDNLSLGIGKIGHIVTGSNPLISSRPRSALELTSRFCWTWVVANDVGAHLLPLVIALPYRLQSIGGIMSEYEDDGLDCCRSIVKAILLSLSLWAVILGVSYGAWKSWHTGRLADATIVFGFVGLILVSLSAWFRHQLSGAREDDGSSAVIKVLKPTNTHYERRHRPNGS